MRVAAVQGQSPKPEAEPAPEPLPAPAGSAAVESTARTARTLAIEVWQSGVKQKSDYLADGISTADAEAWIGHAVDQQRVVTDGALLRPGPVSPYLPEPTAEAGRSDHWTHRFFARA